MGGAVYILEVYWGLEVNERKAWQNQRRLTLLESLGPGRV